MPIQNSIPVTLDGFTEHLTRNPRVGDVIYMPHPSGRPYDPGRSKLLFVIEVKATKENQNTKLDPLHVRVINLFTMEKFGMWISDFEYYRLIAELELER